MRREHTVARGPRRILTPRIRLSPEERRGRIVWMPILTGPPRGTVGAVERRRSCPTLGFCQRAAGPGHQQCVRWVVAFAATTPPSVALIGAATVLPPSKPVYLSLSVRVPSRFQCSRLSQRHRGVLRALTRWCGNRARLYVRRFGISALQIEPLPCRKSLPPAEKIPTSCPILAGVVQYPTW
jgi:hypothetical protein